MQTYNFSFRGNAKEYFGIWIVNILLSIVTVGIYSAWAKVRTNKYFYGNTELDGHNFNYHATGGQILKGRIIAFVAYIAFVLIASLNPIIAGVMTFALLFILPQLLIMSTRFNARISSYRNIGYDFKGRYGKALLYWVILPVVVYIAGVAIIGLSISRSIDEGGNLPLAIGGSVIGSLVLGLGLAFVQRGLMSYYVDNHTWANRHFSSDIPLKKIIVAYLLYFGFLLVIGGLFGWVIALSNLLDFQDIFNVYSATHSRMIVTLFILLYGFLFIVVVPASAFLIAILRNVLWNNSRFDSTVTLHSSLPPLGYFTIILTNLFVTVITLGLMRPWAAVREARYLAEHSSISSEQSLDKYIGDIKASGDASAAEYMAFEGMDMGIGA